MKPFIKRLALVMGLLFTALICMGIVYIDTIQNYWYVNGGFVKLIVSNQTAQATITIDTNTGRVGIFTNNVDRSIVMKGQARPVSTTGNGAAATTLGTVQLIAGNGGDTTANDASGGVAGQAHLAGGTGGDSSGSTTNATGGAGGSAQVSGGAGRAPSALATNSITGGNGGAVTLSGGSGGLPTFATTNAVGGNGGGITANGAAGVTPSAGWIRKPGAGGSVSFTAGNAGNGAVRTNGSDGGSASFTAGNAGSVTTAVGDAGVAGNVNFTGGNGAAGSTGTNSNGGSLYFLGGSPASGAVAGDVILARNVSGTARGGVMVGPFISGGSVSVTNMLGATLALDFPSTAAGTVSDLPIAVTGVESNNCAVALSVPWQSTSGNGGIFTTFNSNDAVYVRFANNNLVTAIDPVPGQFVVVCFRIR